MKKYFNTCLRDCYDTCLFQTQSENGKIKKILPSEKHPVTKGFLCPKGNKLLKYLVHKKRIHQPMLGNFPRWKKISWEQALSKIVDKIKNYPDKVGFFSYFGSTGIISKNFPERFFRKIDAIGFKSSLCDKNGDKILSAMDYQDFQIYPDEIKDFKQVVIWGANPRWSSLHHWFLILKSQLRIIGIDPVKTVTLKDADQRVRPIAGSDWYLAYAIARILIEKELVNLKYIKKNTKGYEFIKKWILNNINLEEAEKRTGVSLKRMKKIAVNLRTFEPGYIYIGFGIQRQKNGGEIIRAISILAAIAGYKMFYSRMNDKTEALNYVKGTSIGEIKRVNQLYLPDMIEQKKIKILFVFNSNPVSTSPNSNRIKKVLQNDDVFVVVSDIFFTDTAKMANLILPASTFFEYFDIATSYFHDFVQINEKVIRSMYESKSNYEQFKIISKALELNDERLYESEQEIAEKFLSYFDLKLEELKGKGFLRLPINRQIQDKIKLRIVSNYIPEEPFFEEDTPPQGSLRLISSVHRDLLSSQYYKITTNFLPGRLFINVSDAKKYNVYSGDKVRIYNKKGEADMTIEVKNEVPPGIALIYKAPWESISGYSPNLFTEDRPHKIYEGAQYYSSFVKIEKINNKEKNKFK